MSKLHIWRDVFVLKIARLRRRLKPFTREFVIGKGHDGHIRRVLFCLPQKDDASKKTIAFLEKFNKTTGKGTEIDFLVPSQNTSSFKCSFTPREVITLSPDSFNVWGIPVKLLRERIVHHGYDLIVDCNNPLVPNIAYLLSLCENALRVGLRHPEGDLFYNIQCAPEEGTYFDIVLSVLDMLKPA